MKPFNTIVLKVVALVFMASCQIDQKIIDGRLQSTKLQENAWQNHRLITENLVIIPLSQYSPLGPAFDHILLRICDPQGRCQKEQTVGENYFLFLTEMGEWRVHTFHCTAKKTSCHHLGEKTYTRQGPPRPEEVALFEEVRKKQKKRQWITAQVQELTRRSSTLALNRQFAEANLFLSGLSLSQMSYLLQDSMDMEMSQEDLSDQTALQETLREIKALKDKPFEKASLNLTASSANPEQQKRQTALALLAVSHVMLTSSLTFGFMAALNAPSPEGLVFNDTVDTNMSPPEDLSQLRASTITNNTIRISGKDIRLPEGYTLTEQPPKKGDTEFLGRGSQGTVYRVKKDKKEYIIKFANQTASYLDTGRKFTKIEKLFQVEDVDVAKKMVAQFNNPMTAEIEYARFGQSKIPVVIKQFIDGPTLKLAIQDGLLFKNADMRTDLTEKFIPRVSQGRHVYGDLNPANLVWNGSQWVVIDAKPPQEVATTALARQRNWQSFYGKQPVTTNGKKVFLRTGIRRFFPSIAQYSPQFKDQSQQKNLGELLTQMKKQALAAPVQDSLASQPAQTNTPAKAVANTTHPAPDPVGKTYTKNHLPSMKTSLRGAAVTGFLAFAGLTSLTALLLQKKSLNLQATRDSEVENYLQKLGELKQQHNQVTADIIYTHLLLLSY